MNIKQRFSSALSRCGNFHPLWAMIPTALLTAALIIRLFSGGTVIIYNAAESTGLFPGAFFYTLGYALRIAISGFLAGFVITNERLYENKTVLMAAAACACVLLLFEYRLIFICIRLFTALLLSFACTALYVLIALKSVKCRRGLFCLSLAAALLQLIFCIQLVTLIFCV